MENALISIIIPVYNAAKYLERSLGSVLKQTYRNLEIITVDDGSKDDSLKLLNSFAASDSRVKVIHKENGGSSSARNAGLKISTGEYIGFIDADDYIEYDMYENLARLLDEDPKADVSQILSCEENENGELIKAFGDGFTDEEQQTGRDFFRALLLHRGDSSFCTKLFRREFFEGFSFPEGRLKEDFDLLVKMS
jgi:glycosyltransferase involved in cell wall biosynthesis